MTTRNGVVVGVTEAEGNTGVLRFAADEAALLGAVVTIAHAAYLPLRPLPPTPLTTPEPMLEIGRRTVHEVARQYRELTGEECREVLEDDPPALVLTRLGESADMIVMAHRHVSAVRRLVTRSTTCSVAAHAKCPVAVVPAGWHPSERRELVTMGVDEAGVSDSVWRAAFTAAWQRGATLRLLYAWRLDPAYDDLIEGEARKDWSDEVERRLRKAAVPYTDQFPKVPVDVEILHQWPADALVQASAISALLVLGRHRVFTPLPTRLGSLVRAVIHLADGPVLVVPT